MPCVIRPCGIAAADFAAKNVPPAHFFNAAHPLRLQIPLFSHTKQKNHPKGWFFAWRRRRDLFAFPPGAEIEETANMRAGGAAVHRTAATEVQIPQNEIKVSAEWLIPLFGAEGGI